MKKPFNLRLPVLFAASLCAGIVYSTVLAYFRLSGFFILIPSLIAFAACVPVAIIKGGVSKPLIIIGATVFFLIGAIYLYLSYSQFIDASIPEGIAVSVSGRVTETGVTNGGNRYVIISDVKVNGERVGGKIAVYLNGSAGESLRRGYVAEFYSRLEKQKFIEYGSVSYNACRGVRYICTVSGNLKSAYRFDLFGEINYAFERALFDNLDSETAAVCFAMLTGNTDAVSAGTISAFRNGGIAHVFAVSGLHIGVIYGALTFIMRRAGANRYVSAAVRITFIALYSGVCLFTASSVRALVMCSVAATAGCFYRKRDSLNALAVAAIILLLINPLYLYGVGFILSFAAVLGILLFGKNLKRLFGFLPDKAATALSVGASTQISTVPVQLTSFGYISAAGLGLNLIFIPLISVLYVLLFICACISALIPSAAGVLLQFASAPIKIIINFVVTCGFENAVISGRLSNWIYVPFGLLFIGLTDKFNLRPLARAAFICAFSLSLLAYALSGAAKGGFATVEFDSGYQGGAVTIKTDEGTVLVITDDFKKRSGISVKADVLIVLGGYDSLSAVTALDESYDTVYMRGDAFPLPSLGDTQIIYSDSFSVCGVSVTFGGEALTANVYGRQISLVQDGGAFDAGSTGSQFELYCKSGDGAVLYVDGGSYALDICGTMRYEISATGYNCSHVVPKE